MLKKIKADFLFRHINSRVGYGTFRFPLPDGQITIKKDIIEYSLPPAVRDIVYEPPRIGIRLTVLTGGECVFLAEKWRDQLLPELFIFKEGEWVKTLKDKYF